MLRDRYARRRLIAFVVLVGMCLVLIAASGTGPVQELRNGVKFAMAPVQDTLADGTRSMTSIFDAITEVDTLRRENDELSAQVEQMEGQLATSEAIKTEYNKLSKLFKTQDRLGKIETVAASVSARQFTQFERLITLDRGTEAGIRDGAPVLSSGGELLGRVTEVGEGWTEVMLLSDSNFLVAGLDNRHKTTGNVIGRLSQPLAMTEILPSEKIDENDLIVTLGINIDKNFRSVYPKGIPIGRVVDIIEESDQVLKTALIVPLADLEHVEHVLVMTNFRAPKRSGSGGAADGG
jgi:rod shape-determining protein MreC